MHLLNSILGARPDPDATDTVPFDIMSVSFAEPAGYIDISGDEIDDGISLSLDEDMTSMS